MDKKEVEPRQAGRSQVPSTEDSRYKFIPKTGQAGKERDVSTGLDYFGARYYDSWRGQWGQVDPMVIKYPGWSPYNYVSDNPIIFFDEKGDTVSIITSGPTYKNSPETLSNKDGLTGHTSIDVDGKVYSFNGDGKWHINSDIEFL